MTVSRRPPAKRPATASTPSAKAPTPTTRTTRTRRPTAKPATARAATTTAKPATSKPATTKPATTRRATPKAATLSAPQQVEAEESRAVKGSVTDFESAWAVRHETGDVWTPRPWVPTTVRQTEGRDERKRGPRTSHAAFEPRAGRDPIAILEGQEKDRLQDLVPLRHARMAESPFAYYRGTPAVMAFDLSETPRTNILVQASGDAHLSNFGIYASPERNIVFDSNDFDETLPAPWEWDVKRLAASVVIAGRSNGFSKSQNRAATMATVKSYRDWMARYAGMRLIDVWYSGITEQAIRDAAEAIWAKRGNNAQARAKLDAVFAGARTKDVTKAAAKLTTIVDGRLAIKEDPPVVRRIELPGGGKVLAEVFDAYRETMPQSLRDYLERYRFADFALKVVGVGSVGTRCFILVLQGRDEGDPLILQAKEATQSVLEPYTKTGIHENHGERVVHGQRMMQATSDIFLGWCRAPAGRDFYFRQLWDMKGTVDTTGLRPPGMAFYGTQCARSLARAHARSGDSIAIAAYLGSGDTFDGAVADFAEAYADQNDRDHAAFKAAIEAGTVAAAGA
jgi:uncharacterized protein (DUF2252 family)